jgi:hypothetical protein
VQLTPTKQYIIVKDAEQTGILTGVAELEVVASSDDNIPVGKKIKIKGNVIDSDYGNFVKTEDVICVY